MGQLPPEGATIPIFDIEKIIASTGQPTSRHRSSMIFRPAAHRPARRARWSGKSNIISRKKNIAQRLFESLSFPQPLPAPCQLHWHTFLLRVSALLVADAFRGLLFLCLLHDMTHLPCSTNPRCISTNPRRIALHQPMRAGKEDSATAGKETAGYIAEKK